MPPERTASQEYRGIKRIQQACTNCRRKKAKCSGERPICSYCKRLSQHCQWGSGIRPRSSAPQEKQDHIESGRVNEPARNSQNDDGLATRVASVESKLDELMSTINAILPTLIQHNNPPIISSFQASGASELSPPSSASVGDFDTTLTFETLPPAQVFATLIDVYFDRVHNQPYAFFHEGRFRQRLADGLLPDYLKFAVLATALRFSEDPYYNDLRHEACTAYASQSWKRLVQSWFATECDPNIYICQAVTLLSVIDFTAGRRHPAWLKIGLSVRIAQDLCLMMEPDSSLSYADQEERRRVFWSIYILDKLCSCGRARPAAIDDAHCHVQLPCDEEVFKSGTWKKMPTLDKLFLLGDSVSEHPGHLAMVVLTSSIVGRCAQHNIHEQSREDGRLPPWNSQSDFATIYSKLLQLETNFGMGSSISEALRTDCIRDGVVDMQIVGPLVLSHVSFHICQVLLHHPFLLYQQSQIRGIKAPPSFFNRALQTCREHASSVSELLREASIAGCLTYFSFLGYCTTVAGGVHTMYLHDKDPNIQQRARACLQSDIAFLQDFSGHWKHGEVMAMILQNLSKFSLASSSLVNSTPQDEYSLDEKLVENLWASVDYTTMSQSTRVSSNSISSAPSPTLTSMFNLDIPGHDFDPDGFISAQVANLNSGAAYSESLFDSMLPMPSFFHGETVVNYNC